MPSAIERILARLDDPSLVDALAERLSGADLTTLLLAVMQRRAEAVAPAQLLRRYADDRFTALPAPGFDALRRVEDTAIASLPPGYAMLPLAPLVPFATHRALGLIDQNRVVSTVRGQEVAADPTNGLALEAAARRAAALRRDPRSAERFCLGAAQRVVRAQHVTGPGRFAHFSLFALVTAGRDTGSLEFERRALREHVACHARCLRACGVAPVTVELSDFADGAFAPVLAAAREELEALPGVQVLDVPERTRARGYYLGAAVRITGAVAGEAVEFSDGGFVDWTGKLVGSAKERCLVSGLGMDRLALLDPTP